MNHLLLAAEAKASPAGAIVILAALIAAIGVCVLLAYLIYNPPGLLDGKRTGNWCDSVSGHCGCQRLHLVEHDYRKRRIDWNLKQEALARKIRKR